MSILDDTYHDRIEAYLLGELSEEARTAFEAELARNDDLKNALEEMKELQADMIVLERDNFLDRLNEIKGELEDTANSAATSEDTFEGEAENEESREFSGEERPKGKVRRFPRWYVAAAAAILLLIVPLYLVLRPPATLVDQYFAPYENLYSNRGSSDAEIKQALADYDDGNFTESITHFDAYLEIEPLDSEAIFYSGIAHLAIGKSEKAIELLSSVDSEGFIYSLRAKWYLSLAYLQKDQKAEARTILEGVKSSKGELGQKASELIDELDALED